MPIQVTHIMTRTFFAQQSIRKRRELEQKRRTEYFTEATVKSSVRLWSPLWSHLWGALVVHDERAS